MRYVKATDIHALNDTQRSALQVGQWVYAGDKSAKGKFLGVKGTGTVVVAWHGNAQRYSTGVTSYWHDLRQYALAK